MHDLLTILYGCIIGFSLGLTGGGGAIFAVPLLIFGLNTGVREAVGISLAAVGSTALFGAFMRWKSGDLDLRRGLTFALSGMLGAPLGTWFGSMLPERLTLQAFAVLMVMVGVRMWQAQKVKAVSSSANLPVEKSEPLVILSSRGLYFLFTGLSVGILSGVFGVGGGFIIVPALVIVGGMSMHRAVATSLLVIALICLSGVTSYFIAGDAIPVKLSALFVAGGMAGMLGGNWLRTRMSGSTLKKIFAAGMWLVAAYVLIKSY